MWEALGDWASLRPLAKQAVVIFSQLAALGFGLGSRAEQSGHFC